jgi:hypothetical protein
MGRSTVLVCVRDHRIELLVVERDALQVLLHELARRDASVHHGLLHVGDGGFDDIELGARRIVRYQEQRYQQQQCEDDLLHRASPTTPAVEMQVTMPVCFSHNPTETAKSK